MLDKIKHTKVMVSLLAASMGFLAEVTMASASGNSDGMPPPAQHGSEADRATQAPTRYISVGEARYAYRDLGPRQGVPIIFLNRFRGTLDDWDPALIDLISKKRRVILFDNAGDSRSAGRVDDTMAEKATSAAAFIKALGLQQVDLFGFSLGGVVALQLTLDYPELVHKLVLASASPGYVEGAGTPQTSFAIAAKPENSDADLLQLFFKDTETSQAAGKAYLARVRIRSDADAVPVSADSWHALAAAVGKISTPQTSLAPRLGAIAQPVLVADGNSDIMLPPLNSYVLAQGLSNAKLVIYPDSGHGFLFQYATAFGQEVDSFLDK